MQNNSLALLLNLHVFIQLTINSTVSPKTTPAEDIHEAALLSASRPCVLSNPESWFWLFLFLLRYSALYHAWISQSPLNAP